MSGIGVGSSRHEVVSFFGNNYRYSLNQNAIEFTDGDLFLFFTFESFDDESVVKNWGIGKYTFLFDF